MTQETLAILAVGFACLGGMVHIVWRLASIDKRLAVVEARMGCNWREREP